MSSSILHGFGVNIHNPLALLCEGVKHGMCRPRQLYLHLNNLASRRDIHVDTMLFNPTLLSILFLLTAFGHELVDARSHKQGRGLSRKAASARGLDVDGLNLLKSYVCPADSNSVKREATSSSTAIPVTVPASNLVQLYQALKSIETQAASSTQRRSDEVSLEITGLDVLKTYVCSSYSSRVKRQTSSTTIITISMEDLADLYQLVLALIAQIEAFLEAHGVSASTIGNAATYATTDAVVSTITGFTSVEFVMVTTTVSEAGYSVFSVISELSSAEFSTATTLTTEIYEELSSSSSGSLYTSSSVPFFSSATTLNSPYTTSLAAAVSSSDSLSSGRNPSPTASTVEEIDSSASDICYQYTDVTVQEITTIGGTTVTIMETQPLSTTTDSSVISVATSAMLSPAYSPSTARNVQTTDAVGTTISSSAVSTVFSTVSTTLSTSVSISASSDIVAAPSTADSDTVTGSSAAASNSTTMGSSVAASSTIESPMSTSTSMDMSSAGSSSVVTSTVDSVSSVTTTTVSSGAVFAETYALVSSSTSTTSTAEAVATYGVSSSSGDGYVFDSQATSNVVVYFGQTAATSAEPLITMCEDPDIDVVVLSFVIARNYSGAYPQVNFGAACGGQTTLMESEAPGLLQCTQLASHISKCQSSYGKKVMLSVGGATAQLSFGSDTDASEFATVLWNLFGPPGSIDDDLRPFGNVTIDGFDVDNEDNLPAHFDTFGTTLRAAYDTDASKDYYLSSAPQCPYPDASNPLGLLLICDFVFVQFYNNPWCEIGSTGFNASLEQWSGVLESSTLAVKPRLYLGAPAFSAAGSTAYGHIGSPAGMEPIARETLNLGMDNFGGVMFWDGPEGVENLENGVSIIEYAKLGLTT